MHNTMMTSQNTRQRTRWQNAAGDVSCTEIARIQDWNNSNETVYSSYGVRCRIEAIILSGSSEPPPPDHVLVAQHVRIVNEPSGLFFSVDVKFQEAGGAKCHYMKIWYDKYWKDKVVAVLKCRPLTMS